jgi:hypothetical protein
MIRNATFAVLLMLPVGSTAVQAQASLDARAQSEVIDSLAARLQREYVFPDVAARMISALKEAERAGRYRSIVQTGAFADSLTAHLQAVSKDRHFRVIDRARPRPTPPPQSGNRPPQTMLTFERLSDNIGYIKLFGFPPRDRLAPDLDRAMAELASTDALIIDLRENGGGSPEGVMYLAGYLLKQRTLVARIYSRPTDSTTEMWSLEVEGPRYDKDVYILTSRRTFSAAEAAAYHLKHLGRAQIVGDTTGGGAHRVSGINLPHNLAVMMPQTRPINVVTGGDWEGVGVIPDHPVATAQALETAHTLILRKKKL